MLTTDNQIVYVLNTKDKDFWSFTCTEYCCDGLDVTSSWRCGLTAIQCNKQ